MALNN